MNTNGSQIQTYRSELVARLGQSMETDFASGLIPLWIYNNPEIFRLEKERIFARNWIFLAHETELRENGDFVTRSIGGDPFIVVRGDDGRIRVLFNSCPHRGTRVCRGDKGRTTNFICPYHSWNFKNTGELTAIPLKQQAYTGLNMSEWGLVPAPRVDVYRGLIFASLDENVAPLEEFLGDFRWYLDLHLALSPEGMEVVGEPQRWIIDGDWKSGAENFTGDSYHTPSLHGSVLAGVAGKREEVGVVAWRQNINVHVTECSGHASNFRCKEPGDPHFWGYPPDVARHFSCDDLSDAQKEVASRSIMHVGTIFPNLSFIHIGLTDTPADPVMPFLSFRVWNPLAPGKMEVRNWILVPKEASAEHKARAYKVAMSTFSATGNFEQDDAVVWSSVAEAAGSQFARASNIRLNYQMGLEGMSEAKVMEDWPGPGVVYDTNLEEGVQRTFFRKWYEAMSRGA